MNNSDYLNMAPPKFEWPQCPEADQFFRNLISQFLEEHSFAKNLAQRMKDETSTELLVWVDHMVIPKNEFNATACRKKYGIVLDERVPTSYVYWHPFADLPRIRIVDQPVMSVAIMVESISDFMLAHDLSLPIEGKPFSSYRQACLKGEKADLLIVERRGTPHFETDQKDLASVYVQAVETLTNRERKFNTLDKGMKHTLNLAKQIVNQLGTGTGAWAFCEGERRYWQKRNRAAQVQKARQDQLGLGWANHDHHTFRSSRSAFADLIKILQVFGFKKRERFYAGKEGGWGAQVLEQPEAKLIIFADVDLTPDEVSLDFSIEPMTEQKTFGTVGLWCALHGESILEAGMHHLEAKFEFDHLKQSLKKNQIEVMSPFSDFPHLRQAFTKGEQWSVPYERLNPLLLQGKLSQKAYDQIIKDGAVGSHLENLQRRNGFKGFNQRSVSNIILEVNPEKQALKKGKQSS